MTDFSNKQIVYFDGVCNLCEGTVQFLLKRNKKKNLLFASLQSQSGQEMLAHFGLPQNNFNSFVFVENGKLHLRSTGALRVTRYLRNGWPLLYGFIIVPPFIRNGVYNWVAKNRYKWYGEKNECWVPTPELKQRFLD
jgi:predicted DCC family thiol-disulfide oxidoreductase YuxK